MIHNLTNFSIGKPLFMPWEATDCSYDCLLGISLTLNDKDIQAVYIEKYVKTDTTLNIVFTYSTNYDDTHKILSSLTANIESGVHTLSIPASPALLTGNITIIDTNTVESIDVPIRISPLYIHYAETTAHPLEITVNDNLVSSLDVQLNFDSTGADLIFGSDEYGKRTVYITLSPNADTVIDNTRIQGITMFGGSPVTYNKSTDEYEGILNLPSGFTVTKVNDSFALIRPYTYETCQTGEYVYKDLGLISCNVANPGIQDEKFSLPLDVCFEPVEDGSYVLKPYRIDDLIAPDNISYLQLNPLH